MVKNKMVKNLPPPPNTRSSKMRSIGQRQLGQPFGTYTNNMSPVSNKDYCGGDVTGNLPTIPGMSDYSLKNIRDATIIFSGGSSFNLSGSTLTNIKMIGGGWCPNMAGTIRNNVEEYSVNQDCRGFTNNPVNSYITFTKDRTKTCITPLGENDSILINRMLTLKYYGNEWRSRNFFNPLDISKVLELDATRFGLQGSNNDRVSRFIFTNSLGKITITGIELISPTGITSSDIRLDNDNKLIITKKSSYFKDSGFKLKINIKQEATPDFREGTASVILEYRTLGDTSSAPSPRCNLNYVDGCLNY